MASGGRIRILSLANKSMTGNIPPEIGLLTSLEGLSLRNNPGLTGCIPANLRGIDDYHVDLPFCPESTSKKALTPAEQSLLG